MSNTIASFDEALTFAATQGITLTPRDYDRITALQAAEKKRLTTLQQQQSGLFTRLVEGFNRHYPQFLQALTGLGDVLMTTTQTIIVSVGVPIVLVLLLIVEQTRVYKGILLFETQAALASFAAWSLVILNLVLEFNIHFIEEKAGYRRTKTIRGSLRLWLNNMLYRLGTSPGWKPQTASPAQSYRQLLRLVTFTILALALAGSMHTVILQAPGRWYQALVSIAVASSLSEMMTWIGGLLFAMAAVMSAQKLSGYVALRCVEISATMQTQREEAAFQTELDSVAANYVMAKIQARKEIKTPEPFPFSG